MKENYYLCVIFIKLIKKNGCKENLVYSTRNYPLLTGN